MTTASDQLQAWLNGTPTGGPNGDGRYPLTYADGTTHLVLCPKAQAIADGDLTSQPQQFAENAEAAATAASASAAAAATAKTGAETARDAAIAAQSGADASKAAAATSATNAKNSENAAAASQAAAGTSEMNAAASKSAAAASASDAAASANAAASSASDAQAYAASINPAGFVHTTGDETVDGVKTFIKTPSFAAGLYAKSGGGDTAGANASILLHTGTFGSGALLPYAAQGSYNSIVQTGDLAFIYSTRTSATYGLTLAPWSNTGSGLRMDEKGQVTVYTNGSLSCTLTLRDKGTNGAGILLVGDGATTPNKYVRARAGALEVVNSENTAIILRVADDGTLTTANGKGLVSTAGAKLVTGPAGGTWSVAPGASNNNAFAINDTAGASQWLWDTNLNCSTSKTLIMTWPLATGTIANGGAGGNYGLVCHANNNGGANAASCAAITFIRDGIFGAYFGLDTDNQFKVGGWSMGNNAYRVLHEGMTDPVFSTGTLSFGATTRQMLNLWGTSYGIGVQNSTLYYRSGQGFAWHRGGVHSETQNDPGAGGTCAMTLSNAGDLTVNSGNRMIAGAFQSSNTGLQPHTNPAGAAFRAQGNFGGGFGMTDGAYGITLFSVTGNLNFGFGSNTAVTGKAAINADGAGNFSRVFAGWDSGTGGAISCNNWFRASGQTGIYFNDYGGGWYMIDSTYVRAYNGKAVAAADFVIASDPRGKAGIRPLVFRGPLKPKVYVRRADGIADFGFLTPDVEALYPEAVSYGADGAKLSYGKLTAVLAAQVNALEDRIMHLEHRLAQAATPRRFRLRNLFHRSF